MEQIWVFKIIQVLIILTFVCLACGCSGEDSCGYDVVGYIKNDSDSMPVTKVKVTELYYNFGDKESGQDSVSHVFYTDSNGKFSYDGWLIPQGAYDCPSSNEIELRFRYEISGFLLVDTVFAKGSIISGGIGERGKVILNVPTIYLKHVTL